MSLLSFGSEEVVEVAKAKGTVDSGRFDGLPPHQRAIIEEDVNCIQDGGGSEDDDQLLDAEHSTEVKKHPTRIIIVEPVLALFFATFVSSQVLISQFALTLVAHHFNYTQSGNTSCGDTNSSNYELQQFVQGRAALLVTLVNVCVDVPGIIMVLIWGVYSDRVGRKLPMILALSGQILKFVVFIITLSLRTNLYLVLVAASIEGLLGGCPTMMMSCMAYISDTCSPVDRTIRLTIVEVSSGVCVALAQVIMGFVIANFGYVIPFYALMVCHLINILYVIFFVPEVRFPVRNRRFIQARHVMQAIRLYSHDDGNRRERWLCLVALIFCASTISGRFDPLILYGLNTPLCWTSIVVGLYVAWTSITSQAGEMALVALLTRHIGELGVSIIGCVSAIAYFVILAFCKNTVAMFLAVLAGVGSFAPVAMIRAFKSKMTSPKDQGAAFAGMSAVETLCGLLGSTVFNPIYSATVSSFRGMVFLVMAGMELCGLVFIILIALLTRQKKRPELVTTVSEDGSVD